MTRPSYLVRVPVRGFVLESGETGGTVLYTLVRSASTKKACLITDNAKVAKQEAQKHDMDSHIRAWSLTCGYLIESSDQALSVPTEASLAFSSSPRSQHTNAPARKQRKVMLMSV